ncbi:MAG: hypothetical protein ACHQQR_10730 [Gemmatimonadales bacterium]
MTPHDHAWVLVLGAKPHKDPPEYVCNVPGCTARCAAVPVEPFARALVLVEWESTDGCGEPCGEGHCGACRGYRAHVAGCPIDHALTLAGLPDQASREAARP